MESSSCERYGYHRAVKLNPLNCILNSPPRKCFINVFVSSRLCLMLHYKLVGDRYTIFRVVFFLSSPPCFIPFFVLLFTSRTSKLHDRKWNHNFTLLNHLSFTLVLYVNYCQQQKTPTPTHTHQSITNIIWK